MGSRLVFRNEKQQKMESIENFVENECTGTDAVEKRVTESINEDQKEAAEICTFYLENKCRFGDQCRNRHEGVPKEVSENTEKIKKKKKENLEEKDKKKKRMKTAEDVIKRLQWDPMLPKEYFIIGYLDRFLGVIEENFTTFCWEDLASVDYDVLAIPQHRIQYFKYKTEKVWDKMDRLDIGFGSTGSTVGIVEFMERVDRRIQEEREKMIDEDGIDSDSDDEFEGPVISVQVQNNVESIPEEERSTHFLALKIEEPEIIENVVKVQKNIIDKEEI